MARTQPTVQQDSAVTVLDLSFKTVWREPKTKEWTLKPPPRRSLDNHFFYTPPGGTTTET
ncbi:hypothetical protein PHMEG_00021336 [Phytophthora megakarya]|uniref:Uncharacterized protein n=1 Tax=Phytophthora megakarya TaxID=4795 RepID=A0A225VLK8_9STRA|nr:hypothetical protein PHMEG_00021336 [Phytophthora megakarya]